MEREDVDRPALAPDRERDLDLDDPTEPLEESHQGVDERGMRLVHKAVESLASPSKVEVDVRTERGRRPYERAYRDAVELAAIAAIRERERRARADTSLWRFSRRTRKARN